ncbi:uncharacterized protein BO66DRAFT_60238 [Aspergillus aculeatinus CBS 121060]|uniref:Uncharacterized protein n=1 Tax=Aspergillus aculeatinus CBS 121060 TaxID=1448322 RepID=A0ACD1HCV3_9EURO|nr:hypothetical protein BO66DRAFT_60238 [Aspergillus aculeatinus CBS 121060]RAH71216.1 hypothetical protein BO66DRAFT_60238 [Aspergillus aculeatinus CBS 121060]
MRQTVPTRNCFFLLPNVTSSCKRTRAWNCTCFTNKLSVRGTVHAGGSKLYDSPLRSIWSLPLGPPSPSPSSSDIVLSGAPPPSNSTSSLARQKSEPAKTQNLLRRKYTRLGRCIHPSCRQSFNILLKQDNTPGTAAPCWLVTRKSLTRGCRQEGLGTHEEGGGGGSNGCLICPSGNRMAPGLAPPRPVVCWLDMTLCARYQRGPLPVGQVDKSGLEEGL